MKMGFIFVYDYAKKQGELTVPKTIKSQVISGVYSTRNVKSRNKYMQLNNKITHVKSRNIEKIIKLVDYR